MSRKRRLIPDPPVGLRERPRKDGSVRIWWEPSVAARKLGIVARELDANRLAWSVREAERLNRDAIRQITGDGAIELRNTGRTIEALIEDYKRSSRWKTRAAKTQTDYNGKFKRIIAKWGRELVRDFSKPVMHRWYETLYDHVGVYYSAALIRTMSLLFSHAEKIGWRDEGTNPCARLQIEIPKGRRRIATWDEVDALVTAADAIGLPSIGTAILISILQGQRETDVRTLQRQALAQLPSGEWMLALVRSKRGNAGGMIVHADLLVRLRPLLDRPYTAGALLLRDDRSGQPWSQDQFSKRFAEVRAAAIASGWTSVADLQFRDMRRTFGARSRAGGASKSDVADVLGNSAANNFQLSDIYMSPQFDTASRAVSSVRRPQIERKKKA